VITTRQQAIRLIPVYRRTTVRRYRPEELQLDLEASRLGVTRQLIIKEWLAERLERRRELLGPRSLSSCQKPTTTSRRAEKPSS
jgi:hypothetical protein